MRALIVIIVVQLFCIASIQSGETMGRLFFTPEQRANLDRLRIINQQRDMTTETVVTSVEGSAKPSEETQVQRAVQGYVKRHDDQQSTIWVNGHPIKKESNHDGFE